MWSCQFRFTGLLSRAGQQRRQRSKHALHPAQLVAAVTARLGPIPSIAVGLALVLILLPPKQIRIISVTSPSGGAPIRRATAEPSVLVRGKVNDRSANKIFLEVNGTVRPVSVEQGEFHVLAPLAPGMNHIRASLSPDRFGLTNTSENISLAAALPSADIRTELTWYGAGDIDLHLVDPNGEECYFGNPRTASGAVLDFDNTVADGPEHITMEHAPPGKYLVKVVYYAATTSPPREVPWTVSVRVEGGPQQRFSGVLEHEKEERDVVSFQVH